MALGKEMALCVSIRNRESDTFMPLGLDALGVTSRLLALCSQPHSEPVAMEVSMDTLKCFVCWKL